MSWYLYGVTAAASTVPSGLVGIDGRDVRLLGDGDLRLIVSEIDRSVGDLERADPADTVAAVRRHDDVLVRLVAVAPVLPVRFGTLLPDTSAADELLRDRHEELARALDAVTGADEWVVQVDAPATPAGEPSPDLTPGHAFFARKRSESEARRSARHRAERAAVLMTEAIESLARGSRPLTPRDPDTVARTAYLVERTETQALVAVAGSGEDATVTVQGPLPPYRFVPDALSGSGR